MILETLTKRYNQIEKLQRHEYQRYFSNVVDFSDKMVGILGSRGVGKTTYILQYLKALDIPRHKKLYFSADSISLSNHSLYEIAEEFSKIGGEVLAIDEIHKYPNFATELKSIYDTFDLKVIFSGSSAVALENSKVDLSRRAVLYRVNGLSFREFLEFETGEKFASYSLEEILENHVQLAYELNERVKPFAYFSKYLEYGYYPFYKQNINLYPQKLGEILNIVLESDLPLIFKIDTSNINKLKKLLAMLCQSKPYELNISKLSQKIELNRATLYNYLAYLEAGHLTKMIRQHSKGDTIFTKPEKLYLNNTNLSFSYCDNKDKGVIREIFFTNQLSQTHTIHYSKIGDFLVDNKYIVEVGGKNKSYKQIKDIENSFIVVDEIEIGRGNKIPLYLFGFLY